MSTLVTGASPIRALNRGVFHPYSDFLLHDMGSLSDGITQNQATGRLMRTQPLWGLRRITTFLHDGRAMTLEAAIAAHDGQAKKARDRFSRLSAPEKAQLIAFLNSLRAEGTAPHPGRGTDPAPTCFANGCRPTEGC